MLPLDCFLALRYLRPRKSFVSFITLLSFLGPALGVAVLIIVNAVMAGFQANIKERIMDWQAHLHVFPAHVAVFKEKELKKHMELMRGYGIKAAPMIQANALIQIGEGKHQACLGKIIYGIDPVYEKNITPLLNDRFSGKFEIAEKEAIIGCRLAQSLGLHIGSEFLIHSPSRLTQNIRIGDDGQLDVSNIDEIYMPERVRVVGLYDLGISDVDDNVIYIHIDQAADLQGYPWRSATSIQGKVDDPMNMTKQVADLQKALNPTSQFIAPARVITWQERNSALFETLRVERTLLLFLMTFILIVASFSIAAILITVVVKKTREIGVLKATGVSSFAIARIFVMQGIVIGIGGSLLGTAAGILVIVYRNNVAAFLSWIVGHDVFPAEMYHLSELPAVLDASDILAFNLLAIVICIFSALIPSLFAASMRPAKSLQEA